MTLCVSVCVFLSGSDHVRVAMCGYMYVCVRNCACVDVGVFARAYICVPVFL